MNSSLSEVCTTVAQLYSFCWIAGFRKLQKLAGPYPPNPPPPPMSEKHWWDREQKVTRNKIPHYTKVQSKALLEPLWDFGIISCSNQVAASKIALDWCNKNNSISKICIFTKSMSTKMNYIIQFGGVVRITCYIYMQAYIHTCNHTCADDISDCRRGGWGVSVCLGGGGCYIWGSTQWAFSPTTPLDSTFFEPFCTMWERFALPHPSLTS